jgi:Zn-finger nucleic acid-binding protein
VCAPHGVWFDRGELAQVLGFCASGALRKASAEAASRREAQRRLDNFHVHLDLHQPGLIDF